MRHKVMFLSAAMAIAMTLAVSGQSSKAEALLRQRAPSRRSGG